METKFQTSFIPRKPLMQGVAAPAKHHGTASLFMTLAIILFIASIVAGAGSYAWQQYLYSAQDTYKAQLVERQKQFNLDLIEQLKETNIQIDLAKQLIDNHIALSQIFDVISRLTVEPVRFMSLDVTAPAPNSSDPSIKINMHGYGANLSVVAFQSDVLGQLEQYGLRRVVRNPILSDPSLDSSGSTVSFGFSASIDPTALSYRNSLAGIASSTDKSQ
jgi:hypothetical protein